jgi:hypothetical protein
MDFLPLQPIAGFFLAAAFLFLYLPLFEESELKTSFNLSM